MGQGGGTDKLYLITPHLWRKPMSVYNVYMYFDLCKYNMKLLRPASWSSSYSREFHFTFPHQRLLMETECWLSFPCFWFIWEPFQLFFFFLHIIKSFTRYSQNGRERKNEMWVGQVILNKHYRLLKYNKCTFKNSYVLAKIVPKPSFSAELTS